MALAAECFVPQLGCEALFPVSGARVPHHHASPHLPTTPVPSLNNNKEFAVPKDYSVPLHVDCSVEYDLPECAKPPQGVKIEPLLMIHPSHFRRLDSLRRCPFINNLPSTNNNSSSKNFEIPSAVMNNSNCTPACQYPQVRATRSSTRNQAKIKESPNNPILNNATFVNNNSTTNKRWSHLGKNQFCSNTNINSNKVQQQYGRQQSQNSIQQSHNSTQQSHNSTQQSHNINNFNGNLLLQPSHVMQYRVADIPDQYWSACGGPALPFAPKEGDTLENSSFCKYPKYRSTSRLRSHPYSAVVDTNCVTPMIATANCDTINNNNNNVINKSNLDILQGKANIMSSNDPVIPSSPYHAKMFSGGDCNVSYQPYPLVMYK